MVHHLVRASQAPALVNWRNPQAAIAKGQVAAPRIHVRIKAMKITNQPCSMKPRRRAGILLALLASVIFTASIAFVVAGGTNAPAPQAAAAKPAPKPEKKKLTGAELYQIHCNRCHAERYPTEFAPAQWKTLVTHMRVRAGLPAAQAREIIKYLQEESGN